MHFSGSETDGAPPSLHVCSLTSGALASIAALLVVAAGVRVVHADVPGPTEIQVPQQGLVFRGPNGHTIARLTADPNGGVFELYDAQERLAARLRATKSGGLFETVGGPLPTRAARPSSKGGAPEDDIK